MTNLITDTKTIVTESFAGLISAFNRYTDDIKMQCAESTMDGDLELSGSLLQESRIASAFCEEIKALSQRWSNGLTNGQSINGQKRQDNKSYRMSPINKESNVTRLIVSVNGRHIDENKAADVFATAIAAIGCERVNGLKIVRSCAPLISKDKLGSYHNQKQRGDWYITTQFNNQTKKEILNSLGKTLKVPVVVDLVPVSS